MALKRFVELTEAELLESPGVWRKKWPQIFNDFGPIAAGTPFVVLGIVPSQALNDAQVAALAAAVDAISAGGISVNTVVQIFAGVSPASESVPPNHNVYFETTGNFIPRPQA